MIRRIENKDLKAKKLKSRMDNIILICQSNKEKMLKWISVFCDLFIC